MLIVCSTPLCLFFFYLFWLFYHCLNSLCTSIFHSSLRIQSGFYKDIKRFFFFWGGLNSLWYCRCCHLKEVALLSRPLRHFFFFYQHWSQRDRRGVTTVVLIVCYQRKVAVGNWSQKFITAISVSVSLWLLETAARKHVPAHLLNTDNKERKCLFFVLFSFFPSAFSLRLGKGGRIRCSLCVVHLATFFFLKTNACSFFFWSFHFFF